MKYRYILAVLLFCALAGSMSCKKSFLDITPKSYLVAGKTSDYDNLLNGGQTAGGPELLIPMGDESMALDPYWTSLPFRDQRLFRWDDQIYNDDENDATASLSTSVYKYNKIINEVMSSGGGSDDQKKALKAEAMACRAWCYYYFINIYALPYNAATAGSDPGYPIVTAADVTATKFTRASVKEVYDFMVNDLLAAIPDIPVNQYTRLRMGKAAAETLLGKIYTFMGNHTAALPLYNSAFADLPTNSTTNPIALYDYSVVMAQGGAWRYDSISTPLGFFTGKPSGYSNTESLFDRTIINYYNWSRDKFVLTPKSAALFGPTDYRLRLYGTTPPYGGTYSFPGVLRKVGPILANVGIDLQDLYLLRAEEKARAGDPGGAMADLYSLRVKRMPAADATVSQGLSQNDLLRFVLDERVREYALTGQRWLDMRRLSVDPLFAGTVYTHSYFNSSGVTTTYTLKPARFALRLPQTVIDQNPGMVNNP